MGSYSDNLAKRLRRGNNIRKGKNTGVERLVSAALVRNGDCHHGARSHADLRRQLGDEDIYLGRHDDIEGFMTSENRFVSRKRAIDIGIAAGQVRDGFNRTLLSSDIQW